MREPEGLPADTRVVASESSGHEMGPALPEHIPLYKVVYAESQRTLDDERDELQGIRTRSVQFTAFVGTATAFLVGTGLHATDRDTLFYMLAGSATVLSAASIAFLIVLLKPSKKHPWKYRIHAMDLITGWIGTTPGPTEAQFLQRLAHRFDSWHKANERLLNSLRRWYTLLILTESAQVTIWATLVWLKG